MTATFVVVCAIVAIIAMGVAGISIIVIVLIWVGALIVAEIIDDLKG